MGNLWVGVAVAVAKVGDGVGKDEEVVGVLSTGTVTTERLWVGASGAGGDGGGCSLGLPSAHANEAKEGVRRGGKVAGEVRGDGVGGGEDGLDC